MTLFATNVLKERESIDTVIKTHIIDFESITQIILNKKLIGDKSKKKGW